MTEEKKKKKDKEGKKKKKKTLLLLGCVQIPPSNDNSLVQPPVEGTTDAVQVAAHSLSEVDAKKAAKRQRKLAKIAARNEKKEAKKLEKLNKKLGKIVQEGEMKDENKSKKKKKKKKENNNGGEATETTTTQQSGRRASIGDDSVVVTELPLSESVRRKIEVMSDLNGAKKLQKEKKKKKKKSKDDKNLSDDEGKTKKRKADSAPEKEDEVSSKKRKKVSENLEPGVHQPLTEEGETQRTEKKKKKSRKNRESAEISDSFVFSASVNEAVDSNDVTPTLSAAQSSEVTKKKSKKSKVDRERESAVPTTTTAATNANSSAAPIPPERASKKKKSKKLKALKDAESTAGSDVDTPMKTAKNQFLTELKGKVKKREVAPLASPLPVATKETSPTLNDEVFATPKRTDSNGAPPRVTMGQWGKVELGSTEKTQKFFRLLGGMKKPTGSPLSFRSSNG